MSAHILLIEDDDRRRVTTLKHLLRHNYQVTPSSSLGEAREILQFISHEDAGPAVVVMAAHLEGQDGTHFRRSLSRRFAGLHWILFPSDRDLDWLAERLGHAGDDGGRFGLDILLVEADADYRARMLRRLRESGDRVTPCRSIAEGSAVLARLRGPSKGFHALVSNSNGLSLYLAAAKRFPGMRWILTSRPAATVQRQDISPSSVGFTPGWQWLTKCGRHVH